MIASKQVTAYRGLVRWLIGLNGTFPIRKDGEGAYYWRGEMRRRVEKFDWEALNPPEKKPRVKKAIRRPNYPRAWFIPKTNLVLDLENTGGTQRCQYVFEATHVRLVKVLEHNDDTLRVRFQPDRHVGRVSDMMIAELSEEQRYQMNLEYIKKDRCDSCGRRHTADDIDGGRCLGCGTMLT